MVITSRSAARSSIRDDASGTVLRRLGPTRYVYSTVALIDSASRNVFLKIFENFKGLF